MQLVSWIREWALDTACLGTKPGSAIRLLYDLGKSLPRCKPLFSHIKNMVATFVYLAHSFRGLNESHPSVHRTVSYLLHKSLVLFTYSFI